MFDEEIDPEKLSTFLAQGNHWLLIAMLKGEAIGKCTAMVHKRPDKDDELYIDEIDVTPKLRQRGIAKMMLDKMLEKADEQGCEECWLGTEKDNLPAQKLYESNGAESEQILLYYLEF